MFADNVTAAGLYILSPHTTACIPGLLLLAPLLVEKPMLAFIPQHRVVALGSLRTLAVRQILFILARSFLNRSTPRFRF